MPHQCVRCNKFYEDGSSAILKGCSCGAKLFFFVKQKHLEQAKEVVTNLSYDDKDQIERDVFDLVGEKVEDNTPVVLEFESINVVKPGTYHIDLVHMFKKDPLIFKVGEGKYFLDLHETFRKFKN